MSFASTSTNVVSLRSYDLRVYTSLVLFLYEGCRGFMPCLMTIFTRIGLIYGGMSLPVHARRVCIAVR